MGCQRESCQRHGRCMYLPCEAPSYADVLPGGPTDMEATGHESKFTDAREKNVSVYTEGKEAGLEGKDRKPPYPTKEMNHHFWLAGWDAGDSDRKYNAALKVKLDLATAPNLGAAKDRVRRVAKGATINGTYRMAPEPALDAFRADLLLIVGD